MNKDQVSGRVEQAKGAVKEVAGKAVGNEALKGEGQGQKVAGKVQSTYGDAKSEVSKTVDKL